MKRFFFVAVAASALLVPAFGLAQDVKTVYRPEIHGTVVVVPATPAVATVQVPKVPPTPAEVIARHEPMAASFRAANRPNYSAAAHCDRLVAEAREASITFTAPGEDHACCAEMKDEMKPMMDRMQSMKK